MIGLGKFELKLWREDKTKGLGVLLLPKIQVRENLLKSFEK